MLTPIILGALLQAAAQTTPPATVPVEKAPASAPVLTAAETAKTLDASVANNTLDTIMKAVMVEGGQASVAMVYRTRSETTALVHEHATEIYYILEGSGMLTTGGTLQNPRATNLDRVGAGLSHSGEHVGGSTRHVGVHDIVIIPGGMAHRFGQLDGPIKYLVYRFDPSKKP